MTRNEGRREIHPALVGEEIARDIDPAFGEAALAPPGEQRGDIRRGAEREEAEIIDP